MIFNKTQKYRQRLIQILNTKFNKNQFIGSGVATGRQTRKH